MLNKKNKPLPDISQAEAKKKITPTPQSRCRGKFLYGTNIF